VRFFGFHRGVFIFLHRYAVSRLTCAPAEVFCCRAMAHRRKAVLTQHRDPAAFSNQQLRRMQGSLTATWRLFNGDMLLLKQVKSALVCFGFEYSQ
jgi:hypothetical protein